MAPLLTQLGLGLTAKQAITHRPIEVVSSTDRAEG
jgi:hypothetical protein